MSQVLPERSSRAPDRFQPSGEIDPLDRMRSLLDQTLGGEIASMLTEARAFTPPVDIEETDDAYVIEADLPGVKREDINTELEGNELLLLFHTAATDVEEPRAREVQGGAPRGAPPSL
jgi:HSP20 family protein